MGVMIKCSKCSAHLQAPQGATSIRCGYCHTVTRTTTTSTTPHHLPGPPCNPRYPPARCPRKKAVICGIAYKDSEVELLGCINDAKSIKLLLVTRFNFLESHIVMLTEEEKDPNRQPTKRNIKKALGWLVDGVAAGDSLVFHFSGHGKQVKAQHDEEVDGYDEYICPLDYKQNGKISDNEINDTIVKPIPYGAKLTTIIDACRSGTMLDLPFLCRFQRGGQYVWEDHRPKNRVWKGTSGGEVIAISGCDDRQLSDEVSDNEVHNGAMTYCLIQAIEKGEATTYGKLLVAMSDAIHKIEKVDDQGNKTYLAQDPQLTANKLFNVYAKPFSL